MGWKNYELNFNPIEFRAKYVKTSLKSNKSNYKFHTKNLKQNAQIIQIKYIKTLNQIIKITCIIYKFQNIIKNLK